MISFLILFLYFTGTVAVLALLVYVFVKRLEDRGKEKFEKRKF